MRARAAVALAALVALVNIMFLPKIDKPDIFGRNVRFYEAEPLKRFASVEGETECSLMNFIIKWSLVCNSSDHPHFENAWILDPIELVPWNAYGKVVAIFFAREEMKTKRGPSTGFLLFNKSFKAFAISKFYIDQLRCKIFMSSLEGDIIISPLHGDNCTESVRTNIYKYSDVCCWGLPDIFCFAEEVESCTVSTIPDWSTKFYCELHPWSIGGDQILSSDMYRTLGTFSNVSGNAKLGYGIASLSSRYSSAIKNKHEGSYNEEPSSEDQRPGEKVLKYLLNNIYWVCVISALIGFTCGAIGIAINPDRRLRSIISGFLIAVALFTKVFPWWLFLLVVF